MTINTTQIISLIIVLAVFALIIYFVSKNFAQSCNAGEIYQNGKCIKDCSLVPDTTWDDIKQQCVPICGEKQLCGNKCIDTSTQKCFPGNIVCPKNDLVCGGICYDPKNKVCIKNKIINKTQLCEDGKTICDDGIICCNNTCCGKSERCDEKTNRCTSCDENHKICDVDGKCYDPNTQQCVKGCGVVDCPPGQSIGGNCNCCPKGQIPAKNNVCCLPENIDSNGNCCANAAFTDKDGKKQCCDTDTHTIVNDKCLLNCETETGGMEYCDDSIGQVCQKIYGRTESGGTVVVKSGCENTKDRCHWSELLYDPVDSIIIDKDGKTKSTPVCSDENGNTYFAYDPKLKLFRKANTTGNKNSGDICNINDCYGRILETENDQVIFNQDTKYCSANFDCKILLPELSDSTICPFQGEEAERCCVVNGKLTGQVCQTGQVCNNGICHPKCDSTEVWDSRVNKCVKKDMTSITYSTHTDSEGDNNQLDYLNRFGDLTCQNNTVMSRFKLNSQDTNKPQLSYSYDCKQAEGITSNSQVYYTNTVDFGSGGGCDHCRTNLANVSEVKCPDGQGLTSFIWEQDPNSGSMGYSDMGRHIKYTCANVSYTGKCREVNSNQDWVVPKSDDTSYNYLHSVYPLSLHNVGTECQPNEYLNSFKYNETHSEDSNTWTVNSNYKYTCCERKPGDEQSNLSIQQILQQNFISKYAGVI